MALPGDLLKHSEGMISGPADRPTTAALPLVQESPLFQTLVKRVGAERASSLLTGSPTNGQPDVDE
jgi:hypothetical protein